jgi:hypothetical protein
MNELLRNPKLGYTLLQMMMMAMQQQPVSTGTRLICLSVCVFLFELVDQCLFLLAAS